MFVYETNPADFLLLFHHHHHHHHHHQSQEAIGENGSPLTDARGIKLDRRLLPIERGRTLFVDLGAGLGWPGLVANALGYVVVNVEIMLSELRKMEVLL